MQIKNEKKRAPHATTHKQPVPEVNSQYNLSWVHAVVRAGVREMAIKGIYLRSERIKEIYRGGAEKK